jgi:hypothetical protein
MKKEVFTMSEEEIGEVMHLPFPELFALCQDNRDILRVVISLAILNGISKGQKQTCLNLNRAMRIN